MSKLAGIDTGCRLAGELIGELERTQSERVERLQLDDLGGGRPGAGALDNAAEILDSVRSFEDLLALFGVLPGFLRQMASELREDFPSFGGNCSLPH